MARSITAISNKKTKEDVLEDLCEQINKAGQNPELIIYTSDETIFWYISEQLKKNFPSAITIGSTSYCEFNDKGYNSTGASALVIFSGIECACGALFEASRHPMNYIMHVKNAMNSLTTLDNTCCIEFCTAFSLGEEIILDTFEEAFEGTNITVAGSSSGASDAGKTTFVALNGEMYKDTCVFCLIHNLEGRIGFYKENLYKPTGIQLQSTDVDCEKRIVYEYNNKPAVDALSEAIGVSKEQLPEYLKTHFVGRVENDDLFITEHDQIFEDGSISYYSRIYNRSKVLVLEPDNEDFVWAKTNEVVNSIIDKPSFSLLINCFGRMRYFENNKIINKYLNVLKDNYGTFISISGYGEQFKCNHLNQTMVIIVFE